MSVTSALRRLEYKANKDNLGKKQNEAMDSKAEIRGLR